MATKHMFAKSPLAQDAFAQLGARQPAARASTSTTSYHAPARFYLYRPVLQGSAYLTRICGLVVRGFTPACRVCAWQVDALWHADRLINTKHQGHGRSDGRMLHPHREIASGTLDVSDPPVERHRLFPAVETTVKRRRWG